MKLQLFYQTTPSPLMARRHVMRLRTGYAGLSDAEATCKIAINSFLERDLFAAPLRKLLERSYWYRLWVIQEYSLSDVVEIACGSIRCTAIHIEKAIAILVLYLTDCTQDVIDAGMIMGNIQCEFITVAARLGFAYQFHFCPPTTQQFNGPRSSRSNHLGR
jgi:hypothetical protein